MSLLFNMLSRLVITFLPEGNGNPLQYSCLENCMDRGAQWAIVGHHHSIMSDYLWLHGRQASLPITNSWSLLKLVFIESVMPFNHLILCRPLLLPSIFPRIRVFSKESALLMRWPKCWSFSFSIIPSKEIPGLISFRMDWLDHLVVQGISRVFSNTTVQKHQFFGAQPSSHCRYLIFVYWRLFIQMWQISPQTTIKTLLRLKAQR